MREQTKILQRFDGRHYYSSIVAVYFKLYKMRPGAGHNIFIWKLFFLDGLHGSLAPSLTSNYDGQTW